MTELKIIENLELWKECRKFRNSISKICKQFPKDEKYRLSDQLIRASRSVTANISEGYGRFHYLETIQFCRMARGSLFESSDHLICAYDEGYINREELKELRLSADYCLRLLNGYIYYLKKRKELS